VPARDPEKDGHDNASNGYYRAGMRRAGAVVSVVAALSSAPAFAHPLTFEVMPPPRTGELVLGETVGWTLASNGPAPERADEHTVRALTFAMWAPIPHVAFALGLPVAVRTTEVSDPAGARIDRSTFGFADMRVVAYGTVLAWRSEGLTLDVALALGLELPTGRDDARDARGRFPQHFQLGSGSWDPFAGATATLADDRFELDVSVAYFLRTEANDVDGGDVFESALSFQYRVAPFEGEAEDASAHAVLESRLGWHDADEGLLAPIESGGVRWSIVPGFIVAIPPHAIDASIELPIVQPVEEHVDFVLRAGYRVTL
jgi:hypothetical protein